MIKILSLMLLLFENKMRVRLGRLKGRILKATIKNKGRDLVLLGYSLFLDKENLSLGDKIQIGENCYFFCRGGLRIGDGTIISRNVTIYTASHNYKGTRLPFDDTYIAKEVVIGKCVWIGMNVNILPGVRIGDGAIIGMGATVAKEVLPGEIVGNVSHRVIASRELKQLSSLID
jgi:acetyltransferase-like isoleucine patch superfamily enzyme